MSHTHDHSHSPRAMSRTRLWWTLILTAGYMKAEFVGGWWFNSLALMADAGHMLSDVASLALALFALWIATHPPTPEKSFGYYRAEILAALVQGASLAAVSVWILIEAAQRLQQEHDVHGDGMMAVATGGLVVNLVSLWWLHDGRNESLNMKGAWLHVLFDALGSATAMAAAALIWAFGWTWADPVASSMIALMVVWSSYHLLAESTSILMESAPRGIDVDAVREAIRAVPGVEAVHDLHVWSITTGMPALSAHVVTRTERSSSVILKEIRKTLHDRFELHHQTIQIESEEVGCSSPS